MIDPSLNDLVAKVLGYGKSMLEMPFSGTPSFFRADPCDQWQ